jgi:hypothetical protein
MTKAQIRTLLSDVKFNDWDILVGDLATGFYIQVMFDAVDNSYPYAPPVPITQKGRKWYISSHATSAEVIQTAFKAVLSAMEHEVREQFLYKGKAIFGPHLDLEQLVELADDTVMREAA